ncbi:MAG: lycopene cyclase [Streptosporangiaceae bacterium]|jgi:lycopene cyclase domain-containing protein|nr:lycopene cyclase [Streptosporangiaceae bacterium]
MDHLQYLLLLAGCLLITLPLELSGARVYRRPRRLARAMLPAAAVFLVWDILAIAGGAWHYNARYLTGLTLPLSVPLEEALFFLVIPLCGVLTFEAVQHLSPDGRRARREEWARERAGQTARRRAGQGARRARGDGQ